MTGAVSLTAANEARVVAAGQRDLVMLRAALDKATGCPEVYRRVAEARLAAPGSSWAVVAAGLGMTKHQAAGYARRLMGLAGLLTDGKVPQCGTAVSG